ARSAPTAHFLNSAFSRFASAAEARTASIGVFLASIAAWSSPWWKTSQSVHHASLSASRAFATPESAPTSFGSPYFLVTAWASGWSRNDLKPVYLKSCSSQFCEFQYLPSLLLPPRKYMARQAWSLTSVLAASVYMRVHMTVPSGNLSFFLKVGTGIISIWPGTLVCFSSGQRSSM